MHSLFIYEYSTEFIKKKVAKIDYIYKVDKENLIFDVNGYIFKRNSGVLTHDSK